MVESRKRTLRASVLHARRPALHALWLATAVCAGVEARAQPIRLPPPVLEEPIPAEAKPRPDTKVPPTQGQDGPSYPFSRLLVEYGEGYPHPIPIDQLLRLQVELASRDGVYSVRKVDESPLRITLAELATPAPEGSPERRLSAGAINVICRALVSEVNRLGVIGVQVTPDPAQIDLRTLADLRAAGEDSTIRILILPGWIREISVSPAQGAAADAGAAAVARRQRIADRSPLKAAGEDGAPGDPIQRDVLDEYLLRVSRHPGRRVDAGFSPSGAAGDVALEYVVSESKPWSLIAQVSNTGTAETNPVRERFGFVHNQLTGRDDILALDYITAGFETTNAVLGSYEARFFDSDTLRWRVNGMWQQYAASDIGFGEDAFDGTSWGAGGEIIANVLQYGELFVDVLGGARFERQEVNNQVTGINGDVPFVLPYLGVNAGRFTPIASSSASLRLQGTAAALTNTDSEELDELGRPNTDSEWVALTYDLSHSFFLEPLLNGDNWDDPDKPGPHTLVHEIALSLRGQWAFGFRLPPQYEDVVGGLYTVRGYPESVTAGDTTIIASAEYRLHLPRAFEIEPDPSKTPLFGRPFRVAPDRTFGYPDWDLVFSTFIDVGRSINSDRESFESDDTLIGTGIGMSLSVLRNLSVRVDWGFALDGIPGEVSAGSNRVNFVVTLQY